ncbi:DUF742 domain-containing protein [Streptomyces sp. NPDC048409]|uniref:DUF742 domain-containing protein n=1 Tax=Streptomyces sp. NPDC048409 TaxID=3154723 RepID=UPI00342CCC80
MRDEPERELRLNTALVPLFVITNGQPLPPEHAYELETLVYAVGDGPEAARTLTPEARRIVELTTGGCLSAAEVAAHTRLPLGVVRILLAQLEKSGMIIARKPVPRAEHAGPELLTAILDGLQARFGA